MMRYAENGIVTVKALNLLQPDKEWGLAHPSSERLRQSVSVSAELMEGAMAV